MPQKVRCRTYNSGQPDDHASLRITPEVVRSACLMEARVIRITDKSFRYIPSYHTDLKKTFKKIEQAVRAAAADSNTAEAAKAKSVVPTIAWRGSSKP